MGEKGDTALVRLTLRVLRSEKRGWGLQFGLRAAPPDGYVAEER